MPTEYQQQLMFRLYKELTQQWVLKGQVGAIEITHFAKDLLYRAQGTELESQSPCQEAEYSCEICHLSMGACRKQWVLEDPGNPWPWSLSYSMSFTLGKDCLKEKGDQLLKNDTQSWSLSSTCICMSLCLRIHGYTHTTHINMRTHTNGIKSYMWKLLSNPNHYVSANQNHTALSADSIQNGYFLKSKNWLF